jgi:hypothetical protein
VLHGSLDLVALDDAGAVASSIHLPSSGGAEEASGTTSFTLANPSVGGLTKTEN